MLWYKAWLETRARFLTSLVTLTIFCAAFVHHAQGIMDPPTSPDFNRLLYITQQYVVIMWIASVVLLGMGGLLREKAMGSSSLTLALPVSRARLLSVRVGVGAVEAIGLGVVPWIGVFVVASIGRMPVILAQVLSYVLLLVSGGMVYYAMAVLVSSLVAGEYSAPALAFGLVLLSATLFDAWLRRFNLWRLVTGDFSLDKNTYLLTTHQPWLGILCSLSVAALMILAAEITIERKEF